MSSDSGAAKTTERLGRRSNEYSNEKDSSTGNVFLYMGTTILQEAVLRERNDIRRYF